VLGTAAGASIDAAAGNPAGGAAIGARSGVFVGGATGVNSVQASGLSPGASSPPDCWLSIRSHAGR
jgi:hypothetical protein